ncbi:MAG TPA: glycoside hydrolase [Prolixibacteraceae bacterium]|nr:glycoside hydrolase [Prolixibacteraceae bacterium]
MNKILTTSIFLFFILVSGRAQQQAKLPTMYFGDTVRTGIPFSKDPHVIWFQGKYLMYYSVPGYTDKAGTQHGWGVAIAKSTDLVNWERVGEVNADPNAEYESKGFAAPCALVVGGKVHLFYQTYGNGRNDAICHAESTDGLNFTRDKTNPIFKPDGDWNCGRAIDAEVIRFKDKYFLYFATRDTAFKIQMQGVAVAPGNTNFSRSDWQHLSTAGPMLKPELPWEKDCIEGASVIEKNGRLYMFYAGAYNNTPQQIGVATSSDGINWERLFVEPFLTNGEPGEWNESESGHPHIFANPKGDDYLFFQGNKTNGKDWFLSNVKVVWQDNLPKLKSGK